LACEADSASNLCTTLICFGGSAVLVPVASVATAACCTPGIPPCRRARKPRPVAASRNEIPRLASRRREEKIGVKIAEEIDGKIDEKNGNLRGDVLAAGLTVIFDESMGVAPPSRPSIFEMPFSHVRRP